MSVGNKRTSQLVGLTATEVSPGDLFYIVDISAKESKKITADDLATYFSISGSLYVLHSIISDTASYIFGGNVVGAVPSSSFAALAALAISSSYSDFAALAISASYAKTASWINGSGAIVDSASWASQSLSASYVRNAETADSANYLQYVGTNNGTASYSIKTRFTDTAKIAETASYFQTGLGPAIDSASYAGKATQADVADVASNALYLAYSGTPNGTSSYAINAGAFPGLMRGYGLYNVDSQSAYYASIDELDVISSDSSSVKTIIESLFTVKLSYTASNLPVNETVEMWIVNRDTGISQSLDTSSFGVDMGVIMNMWGGYNSGSITLPTTLIGQTNMYGPYIIYITSSANINLETRVVRFNVSSISDNVIQQNNHETIQFAVYPEDTVLTFYSIAGGPFTDTSSGIIATGSANIYTMSFSGTGATAAKYIYTLTSLTELSCSNNPSLTYLSLMPNSLIYLDCDSCALSSLFPLDGTFLEILNCSSNNLIALPALPITLLYLNCSENTSLNTFPNALPSILGEFYCDGTSITTLPTLPDTLSSMSVQNNSGLTALPATLPVSISYLKCDGSPIIVTAAFPSLVGYSYLVTMSLNNCGLDEPTINQACQDLYANGTHSGSLDVRNNVILSDLTYVTQLINGLQWTVLYDL